MMEGKQAREKRWKRVVAWCLRIALAAVFFYAGWIKISDPTLFALKVRNYDLLPDPWVAVVAVSLPWLEIICGLCIVSRRLQRAALMWVLGMLLVFLCALISAWVRGLNIDCGCFGEALDRNSLVVAATMDLVLLTMTMFLLCRVSAADFPTRRLTDKP